MTADVFVAKSSPDDALVGPLKTITYVTADPDGASKMLIDGMKLEGSDWYVPEGDSKALQSKYFGFESSDDWKARCFYRNGEGANIQIRLLAVGSDKLQIRPAVDGSYVGGLSIGFPMTGTDDHEERLSSMGFPSVVGVKRLEFASPTGETYISEEVHFPGPDNVYILGVNRPDIFVPVGPIDSVENIGAPAYSASCVIDCDATMAFYSDVLGYEIRRDMTMEVGDKSGLKLPKGIDERFVQAFAPGANTGYLVFLDHGDERKYANSEMPLGPPSRGVSMWSFPTNDLRVVQKLAVTHGAKILQDIAEVDSPFIAGSKTIIIEDPSGYPLEIYEV